MNDAQRYKKSEPIYIYNRDEHLQLILTDYTVPYFNGWVTEQLNGEVSLEFEISSDVPEAELIEQDGRAVTKDRDGNLLEFIIRKPEDTFAPARKAVYAEGGIYELNDEWLTGYEASNVTLRTALSAILQGTRWEVGELDDFSNQSVSFEDVTVRKAVHDLVNQFEGEIRYRIEANGNQITRRYVDVLNRRGANRGHRIEDKKNLLSSTYTPDTTGIKTALYGRGASQENDGPRIDFADVEWSKANGDPADKPLGQTWIGDPDALQKWGYNQGQRHRFGMYDGQEEDPAELLLNTWKDLQSRNDVNETYDFKVLYDDMRLGDTLQVVNRDTFPHLSGSASVIEFRQNLNDFERSEVTLGEFRRQFDTATRTANTEREVNRNRGNWDKKETPEGAQQKADEALSEAQIEINAATERLEEAEQDITQTQSELDQSKQDLNNLESNLSSAQTEIDNAKTDIGDLETALDQKIPIGMAAEDINQHNTKILGKNLVVDGNTTITGTLGASEAMFQDMTTQNMSAIDATIEDATITGSISGDQATFLDATFRRADIIDANVEDATVTGTLNGVDGRFTGQLDGVNGTFIGDLTGGRILSNTSIEVDTDLYVGDNVFIGTQSNNGSLNSKNIYLNDGASIESTEANLSMNAENYSVNAQSSLTWVVDFSQNTRFELKNQEVFLRGDNAVTIASGNDIFLNPYGSGSAYIHNESIATENWVENNFVSQTPSESFVEPTLDNGWEHYIRGARYTKTDDGLVVIEGTIRNGNLDSTAFTLPSNCRPSGNLLFYQGSYTGGIVRVDVNSDGSVDVRSEGDYQDWVSLSGIIFYAN